MAMTGGLGGCAVQRADTEKIHPEKVFHVLRRLVTITKSSRLGTGSEVPCDAAETAFWSKLIES